MIFKLMNDVSIANLENQLESSLGRSSKRRLAAEDTHIDLDPPPIIEIEEEHAFHQKKGRRVYRESIFKIPFLLWSFSECDRPQWLPVGRGSSRSFTGRENYVSFGHGTVRGRGRHYVTQIDQVSTVQPSHVKTRLQMK